VQCEEEAVPDLEMELQKTFESQLQSVEVIKKEDLDLVNHLSGKRGRFLKLSFNNVQELMDVKAKLLPVVEENKRRRLNEEEIEGQFN
jgi:DNA polymerase epsilon subunit 1